MNALSVCLACDATAEGCQLKHHFSGRACCLECQHEEIDS